MRAHDPVEHRMLRGAWPVELRRRRSRRRGGAHADVFREGEGAREIRVASRYASRRHPL